MWAIKKGMIECEIIKFHYNVFSAVFPFFLLLSNPNPLMAKSFKVYIFSYLLSKNVKYPPFNLLILVLCLVFTNKILLTI